MQRSIIIILFLFIFLGCAHPKIPTILTQVYNSLLVEGKMNKLWQSNDTLLEHFCLSDTCITEQNRIIGVYKMGEFTVLKLQGLDSMPSRNDFCPGKHYYIVALKSINNNQIEYYWHLQDACLTRYELDT